MRISSPLIVAAEIFIVLFVFLFCLAARLNAPERIYSLHAHLSTESAASEMGVDPQELVQVNLPPEMEAFFDRDSLLAYRLYQRDNPPIYQANQINLDLLEILRDTQIDTEREVGLFFYVIALNERPCQFRMRLRIPSLLHSFSTATPTTESGKMVWYGRFSTLPQVPGDAEIFLDIITPGARSYVCDIGFYSAPALTLTRPLR